MKEHPASVLSLLNGDGDEHPRKVSPSALRVRDEDKHDKTHLITVHHSNGHDEKGAGLPTDLLRLVISKEKKRKK